MPGALPVFLLAILGILALATTSLHAVRAGRTPLAVGAAIAAAGWTGLYGLAVIAVSLASDEQVLSPGEYKRFCGLYLDCHAMVTVAEVDARERIGDVAAQGVFYVITVRQASNAKRARIGLAHPTPMIRDGAGRRYWISERGASALANAEGVQPALGRTIAPDETYDTKFVFDLPRDVQDPRLHVRERQWTAVLSELFLIGDEDSFLHRKTVFALTR